jgi:hypothetical protein
MTRIKENKLNHLVASLPHGLVLTTNWLETHNISPKLAWWYVQSGWLDRVGEKAYKKAGDNVKWTGAVAALQYQLNLPLHVGGKTALQLLGRSHFLPVQGIKQATLFANQRTKVPSWLEKNKLWDVNFEIFRTNLFRNDDTSLGIIEKPVEGINLKLSCPERAAMEILYCVPDHQSFDEAVLLMENLGQSRPAIVQSLLEKCNSIKVKRLFLLLAERHQHAWLSNLDLKKIDLGHGKRVIGEGGKYNSKYLISVPDTTEE